MKIPRIDIRHKRTVSQLPHRERLMLASRRVTQFAKTKFPSRTLGQMSLCGNSDTARVRIH